MGFFAFFCLVTLILDYMVSFIVMSFLSAILIIIPKRMMSSFLKITLVDLVTFVEFLVFAEITLLVVIVVEVRLLLVFVLVIDIVETISFVPLLMVRRVTVILALFASLCLLVRTVIFSFVDVSLPVLTSVLIVSWQTFKGNFSSVRSIKRINDIILLLHFFTFRKKILFLNTLRNNLNTRLTRLSFLEIIKVKTKIIFQ